MKEYKSLCDRMLELLSSSANHELGIVELCQLLPDEKAVEIAFAYAILVAGGKVRPVYRIVGVKRDFDNLDTLITYWEENKLPRNTDTQVYARLTEVQHQLPLR